MKFNIFVICHKPSKTLNTEIFRPLQVGVALKGARFDGYLHDDEGENISYKNPYYCELTGMYWAWKHVDADYYGLMHYRRYFSFSGNVSHPYIDYPTLDDSFLSNHGYDEAELKKLVEQYDIIVPMHENMQETVYDQYKNSVNHHAEDLDTVLDIIHRKYPQFDDAVKQYMNGKNHYFCNMFVMKKELFQAYCAWLFSILEEHEILRDRQDYNVEETRVSGFLSERLLGVYFTYLKMNHPELKYKELPRVHFQDTDVQAPIAALSQADTNSKEIVPIVFSVNEPFMPYLAVTIQSIIEHASENHFYHMIVLHNGGLTVDSMSKVQKLMNKQIGKLEFYHVGKYVENTKFFVDKHLSVETYFRLFIQDILPFYNKVLYLDCDLVVEADVAKLYDIDLTDYYLAAAKDIDYIGCWKMEQERKNYTADVLQMKTGLDYFQAGVLVLNLQEFRKHYAVQQLIEVALSKKWQFHDQDILNHICQGKVYHLPQQWNVVMNWREPDQERMAILRQAPKTLFDEYQAGRKQPYVIHYAGYQKPWNALTCDYDHIFWNYARKTAFYEQIMACYVQAVQDNKIRQKKMAKLLTNKARLNRIFPPGTKRRNFAKAIKRTLKI